jgi:peptidoglycan/xylan/chitin deacetylase (PgdA/CDA1 family)
VTPAPAVPGPVRDVVGYGGRPPTVTWPGGARVAVALTVHVVEGSELAIGNGDPVRETGWYAPTRTTERDLAAETMVEYGARAGIWRLLAALHEHGVPATFFASAVALEKNPAAAAELRPRGHEVAGHGYRWEAPSQFSREQEAERIGMAVASITATTGGRPVGWLSRSTPSVHTRELLVAEGGFRYDSDSAADDLPFFTEVAGRRHLVVPTTLANSDSHFEDKWFGSPVDFERQLTSTFDRLHAEGATSPKTMTVGLLPHVGGHPGRVQALTRFLQHAQETGDVWFARRVDIADHWIEQHG